jgi:predicted nucleotidyltransferase
MISDQERQVIRECAEKYKARKVVLFGSALEGNAYSDIDLGVQGIPPQLFFKFYGELFQRLSLPVDLINLSSDTLFNRLVEEEGIVIYGTP